MRTFTIDIFRGHLKGLNRCSNEGSEKFRLYEKWFMERGFNVIKKESDFDYSVHRGNYEVMDQRGKVISYYLIRKYGK